MMSAPKWLPFQFRLTIFGCSLLLACAEVLANVICWAVAGILFAGKHRSALGLAMLAWTTGLRHGLDADHISAIDNATRTLINMGQVPVTCGLFFSLGHSTIVIVVNIAIAISTGVANRIGGVGEVGGVVGASVSGSFLFMVGVANTIILVKLLRRRSKFRHAAGDPETMECASPESHSQGMIMTKLLGPIIKFVNQPWKMYVVGVAFGFGFDTASSIALLSISAIAQRDADGHRIPPSQIVIFPFIFTAGMTLVDSLDSILMLYSYTNFAERTFAIFERTPMVTTSSPQQSEHSAGLASGATTTDDVIEGVDTHHPSVGDTDKGTGALDEQLSVDKKAVDDADTVNANPDLKRQLIVKRNTMSGLSLLLTVISILLAFSISLITIMALIGEQCRKCAEAAESADGGGLAGSWWRGWANAADSSGYIGAAIVGVFVLVVSGWYGVRWATCKVQRKNRVGEEGPITQQ